MGLAVKQKQKKEDIAILLVKFLLVLSASLLFIFVVMIFDFLKSVGQKFLKRGNQLKNMERKKLLLMSIPIVFGIAVVLGFVATNVFGYGASIKFISGTEYQQGEPAQVIVRVVNAWGVPITADWCRVTIYYPDKTVFANNTPMTQGGAPGSWYYSFTTPFDQIGVFEEYVVCQVTLPAGPRTLGAGSSFHVSQTLTMVNETSSARVIIIS